MPTLRQSLEALPHRDVRGIATRLGVRRRGEHRKDAWISEILQAWHGAADRTRIIAGLSSAALSAAVRLAQGGEFPAVLFLAEYGAVRRPQSGQHWLPPPWEAPQTISEELYYCGLLAAMPPALLEKAVRLALPADLQTFFADDGLLGQRAAAPAEAGDAGSALLHDLAQTLCFLAEQPGRLLHGRWLAPAALAELNGRLLRPQPAPLPRTHARARRLRFLFFLAAAAGLCAGGILTPLGWAWLAEPAAARLLLLWNAWRTAPLALRRAYRQATAALPEPWPDLALGHLANLPPTFTAPQWAQAVLGQETAFAAFFTANLPDISALDAAAAGLIETLVEDWGALAAAVSADGPSSFSLTTVGRWLLAPVSSDLSDLATVDAADPAARLEALDEGGWRLIVSPCAPPLPLARLAAYARHIHRRGEALPGDLSFSDCPTPDVRTRMETDCGGSASPLPFWHVYRLDEATVAAAAAAGHGLPALLAAFAGLGVELSGTQLAALQTWHARGHELQLLVLPLLRTARPELLARLLADGNVRAGLGELLSPTVAVTALPPADLADRLRTAGFFPQGPGGGDQGSGGGDQEAGGRSQAAGSKQAVGASNPQSAIGNRQSSAALWLAGQLYAALGEHTPLPLPPPFADLTGLLAALPPLDQAVVQAQWERLRADFQTLLDGRTFAPPPEPSDPARWRPVIESAIAAGRSLNMQYFTAGRNVLTQRTVTPYWIEEHRGIPYLRADCHLAGRVLLFRLDRIQALEIADRDER